MSEMIHLDATPYSLSGDLYVEDYIVSSIHTKEKTHLETTVFLSVQCMMVSIAYLVALSCTLFSMMHCGILSVHFRI